MKMLKRPIRIAHVVGKVVVAGVDSVVMNYYRNINKNEIQFDFFMDGIEASPYDEEIKNLGGRVYKLPAYTDSIKKNLDAFRKILNENDYKIVHCHMNTLSVFWLSVAKQEGVPIRIAHSHSTASKGGGEGIRNFVKYCLKTTCRIYPTHYCACSNYAGEWLFGKNWDTRTDAKVVRNAIDISRFRYNDAVRTHMRNEMDLSNRFVVGHVGRFVFQKNHEFLLKIFAEVRKLRPEAVLLLVGDGPLRNETEKQADDLQLGESVRFLGIRHDIQALMQAMDVFLLPSRYEGLPVVGVEAQAAGLACIFSSNISSEAVLTTTCKMLDLKSSISDWAHTVISECKENSREKYAVELREKGYDIRHEAEQLASYYLKLIAD
jgi:glycosyltransferase involved in cell wall biosynthesis